MSKTDFFVYKNPIGYFDACVKMPRRLNILQIHDIMIMVIIMKLITFQTMEALKNIINNGELIFDEKYIDIKKWTNIWMDIRKNEWACPK